MFRGVAELHHAAAEPGRRALRSGTSCWPADGAGVLKFYKDGCFSMGGPQPTFQPVAALPSGRGGDFAPS